MPIEFKTFNWETGVEIVDRCARLFAKKVMGFESADDMFDWLLSNDCMLGFTFVMGGEVLIKPEKKTAFRRD
jgi:hypothetical protein